MQSHAAVPIAEALGGGLFRIYFSSRDRWGRSHTGFLVIDIQRPSSILDLSLDPVLSPGVLGAFDDSGAMATWLTQVGTRRYLYYIGWSLGVTVPFRNAIGVAISEGDRPFERAFEGPIVDRIATEPYFCASCSVYKDAEIWRMWYLSSTGWTRSEGKPIHHYHIKYAESQNGLDWCRSGRVAIDYKNSSETAISRPSVLKDQDGWRMWFSARGSRYRLGYAISKDGKTWKRNDAAVGIDVSTSGWDSEMICYPFVFDHEGERYMLYNGNGYGRSGLGLAVRQAKC